MPVLCDATAASGSPCKNRSVGDDGGRQYCCIASHKAQVEAMPPRADEVPEEQEVEFVPAPTEMVEAAEAGLLDVDTVAGGAVEEDSLEPVE